MGAAAVARAPQSEAAQPPHANGAHDRDFANCGLDARTNGALLAEHAVGAAGPPHTGGTHRRPHASGSHAATANGAPAQERAPAAAHTPAPAGWVEAHGQGPGTCITAEDMEWVGGDGAAGPGAGAEAGLEAGPPGPLPMLASACPGWVCYAEKTHGEYMLPYISTAKSPQARRRPGLCLHLPALQVRVGLRHVAWQGIAGNIVSDWLVQQAAYQGVALGGIPRHASATAWRPRLACVREAPAWPCLVWGDSTEARAQAVMGTVVKRHLAARLGLDPASIYHVAIMPCYDKKLEASRDDFNLPGALRGGPMRLTLSAHTMHSQALQV